MDRSFISRDTRPAQKTGDAFFRRSNSRLLACQGPSIDRMTSFSPNGCFLCEERASSVFSLLASSCLAHFIFMDIGVFY